MEYALTLVSSNDEMKSEKKCEQTIIDYQHGEKRKDDNDSRPESSTEEIKTPGIPKITTRYSNGNLIIGSGITNSNSSTSSRSRAILQLVEPMSDGIMLIRRTKNWGYVLVDRQGTPTIKGVDMKMNIRLFNTSNSESTCDWDIFENADGDIICYVPQNDVRENLVCYRSSDIKNKIKNAQSSGETSPFVFQDRNRDKTCLGMNTVYHDQICISGSIFLEKQLAPSIEFCWDEKQVTIKKDLFLDLRDTSSVRHVTSVCITMIRNDLFEMVCGHSSLCFSVWHIPTTEFSIRYSADIQHVKDESGRIESLDPTWLLQRSTTLHSCPIPLSK